jgi:hypothetical protein
MYLKRVASKLPALLSSTLVSQASDWMITLVIASRQAADRKAEQREGLKG